MSTISPKAKAKPGTYHKTGPATRTTKARADTRSSSSSYNELLTLMLAETDSRLDEIEARTNMLLAAASGIAR